MRLLVMIVPVMRVRRLLLMRPPGVRTGHPGSIASHVVFFLPDRQAVLDLVDDVAAGAKGLVAMRRSHTDPHGQVTDGQVAGAVHAMGSQHAIAIDRLLHDTLALGQRQFGIGFVFQAADLAPIVMVAHPAFETAKAARCGVLQRIAQRRDIHRMVGKAEATHPPATGGMKTTVSPSLSEWLQSLNCSFTATFKASAGKVKPWRWRNSSYSSRSEVAAVTTCSLLPPACSRSCA